VHGAGEVARAEAASAALFGRGALEELGLEVLTAALADAPALAWRPELPAYVDLLAEGFGISRSEVRRVVKDGGAYANNTRLTDETASPVEADWLHGRFLVLRRGKRHVLVVHRDPQPQG
jgi:tyrosyl-tRNA synthetase